MFRVCSIAYNDNGEIVKRDYNTCFSQYYELATLIKEIDKIENHYQQTEMVLLSGFAPSCDKSSLLCVNMYENGKKTATVEAAITHCKDAQQGFEHYMSMNQKLQEECKVFDDIYLHVDKASNSLCCYNKDLKQFITGEISFETDQWHEYFLHALQYID